MIPTTIEILIWMTNASPIPSTWRCRSTERQDQEVADRDRDEVADDRPHADRQDRLEQPRPKLAEMVDERHDGLVAGRGGGRRGPGVGPRRNAGDARLEQGVGVGHERVADARLARDRGRIGGRCRGRGTRREPAGRHVDRGRRRDRCGRCRSSRGGRRGLGDGSRRGSDDWGRGDDRGGGWRGAAGSGEVSTSTLTESWRSVEALRNSLMLLPSDAPTSGSLPGPRIRRAITRMMMSSGAPMFGISVLLLTSGRRACRSRGADRGVEAAVRRLG